MKQKVKTHYIGFIIFTGIFLFIVYIIFFSCNIHYSYVDSNSSFQQSSQNIINGLSNLNDFFTSLLLLFSFFFAFFIYLANQGLITNETSMSLINNMPDFLPFKHTLHKYFSKFIKKDFKIIVLIRTLDAKNHAWVLNQIAAYNSIINNPHLSVEKKTNIEFLLVNKHSDDIETLISNLNFSQHHYIIISSLSAIFKDAIIAREKLPLKTQGYIQIIGALSSINDEDIQHLIDTDDKIIRIFPPDYDEAHTAIEFIFSNIKNSVCSNEACTFHVKKQKQNIIIIHNGTYGKAVKDKCFLYFKKELQSLNINTSADLSSVDLEDSIEYYSFDFKHNDILICDKTKNENFSDLVEKWSDAKNYFYIIGYEPNISQILEHLDKELQSYPKLDFSLLFSGTASMKTWRESIKKTLSDSKYFQKSLMQTYHLKLHTFKNIQTIQSTPTLNISIKHYHANQNNEEANIFEEMKNIFPKKHINEIENILNTFWKNENNYITTFTIDSIKIALYAIENDANLLESKFKVLNEHGRNVQILVNGDSINQYSVSKLD